MNRSEEAQFEMHLVAAIDEAIKLDYHPHRFQGMIRSKGAFQTVKDIVASGKPSDGFDKLVLYGRPDLTCESIIVETRWRPFFDDDLLEIAQSRLTKYGYRWTAFTSPSEMLKSGEHSLEEEVDSTHDITPPEDFLPPVDDHRERAMRMAYHRPDQPQFREALIRTYGPRCLITGTTIIEALEAAHICAYRGERSNHIGNGLLLRADLHNLFDRFMFSINPVSLNVTLSESLSGTAEYRAFDNQPLRLIGPDRPSARALSIHWSVFLEAARAQQ